MIFLSSYCVTTAAVVEVYCKVSFSLTSGSEAESDEDEEEEDDEL